MKISDALKLSEEQLPTKTASGKITADDINQVLIYFKAARPGYYNVSPDQVEKIKASWDLLHEYDTGYDYTFNDSFTQIRKSKL